MRAFFLWFWVAGFLQLMAGDHPRVLMLISSDLGMGDLSLNGGQLAETPRIDSLAASGLRFEKFYATPVASTSMASLLTGRYHYRTGVFGEGGPEAVMHESEHTLGELFRESGYRTGWFGRWNNGRNWPHSATGQGFDVFTESFTIDQVRHFLTTTTGPTFCVVYFPRPRLTFSVDLTTEERLAKIAEQLRLLDQETGQLLDHLDATGTKETTIVTWLSDNGPDLFGETQGRYNAHFYGGRGSVHEGGVRVPCFISWPGVIKAGSRFTRIASVIDWYPTLASLCGLPATGQVLPLDGSDLSPVLRNGGDSRDWPNRILFTSWTPPGCDLRNASVAVRSDRWVALRDPRWRRDDTILTRRNGWELYDLNADPFENDDQGDRYPYLLSDLRADFMFWMDDTTDEGLAPIATHLGHPEWPEVTFEANPALVWPIRVVTGGDYELTLKSEAPTQEIRGRWQVGERSFPCRGGSCIVSLRSTDSEIRWLSENGSVTGSFSLALKK